MGTSRQPRQRNPNSVAEDSTDARAADSWPGGIKAMPMPNDSGNSIFISRARLRMKAFGIGVRMPAPSPLSPSASTPPR